MWHVIQSAKKLTGKTEKRHENHSQSCVQATSPRTYYASPYISFAYSSPVVVILVTQTSTVHFASYKRVALNFIRHERLKGDRIGMQEVQTQHAQDSFSWPQHDNMHTFCTPHICVANCTATHASYVFGSLNPLNATL